MYFLELSYVTAWPTKHSRHATLAGLELYLVAPSGNTAEASFPGSRGPRFKPYFSAKRVQVPGFDAQTRSVQVANDWESRAEISA